MYCTFTYIYHKDQPNVAKYTSRTDPMGYDIRLGVEFFEPVKQGLNPWKPLETPQKFNDFSP